MCSPLQIPPGRFTARAWQADVAILELEKTKQQEKSPDFLKIICGGIELCETILVGSRWSPETPSVDFDSATFYQAVKRHNPNLVQEDSVRAIIELLQSMAISKKTPSPFSAKLETTQTFFSECLKVCNNANARTHS